MDRLDERLFVGREREVTLFRHWLAKATDVGRVVADDVHDQAPGHIPASLWPNTVDLPHSVGVT